MVGHTLSHYRILEKLGAGGMGVLYRALDTRLDRVVAIKVLRPEAVGDADRKKRFVQEAKAASALNHPNIVTVYDIGQAPDDGRDVDFIAMEYVDGRALDTVMAGGKLPLDEALGCAVQIAEALAAAHAAGIVHRDIKPANVMVTASGRVKVLDFGLAKLTERLASGEARPTMTAGRDSPTETTSPQTERGALMGTPAYMSPEQAEGKPVDARSDVFSFGATLYEMLAGRRPFQGDSSVSTLTAILRDPPPPLKSLRPDVPREVERIVSRCLAKGRDARYASGADVLRELQACRARLATPAWSTTLLQPRLAVPAAAILLALSAAGAWLWMRGSGPRWARSVALPQIQRLVEKEDYFEAFRLARQAERHLSGDPSLERFWVDRTFPFTLDTDPDGAEVQMKPYSSTDAAWEPVGRTPIKDARLPFVNLRLRIAKEGFESLEVGSEPSGPTGRVRRFRLDAQGTLPEGMVRVPAGSHEYRSLPAVELAEFWIDRYEVTNRRYKEFVDKGGYATPDYWQEPFRKDGRVLAWKEAMALLHDTTGRPGPATWEQGAYPEGQADYPVSGVSWFEAAAYARFAGKELPTLYHWTRASGVGHYSDILLLSNFGGKGPAAAGSHLGVSPFGTYDMAGNVKEWCWNESGERRYIMGGGWNEPGYMFTDSDAQSPWERRPSYGFRCVKYAAPPSTGLLAAIDVVGVTRNYAAEKPVPDEVFRVYSSLRRYDKTELNPALDLVEEAEQWRHEKVSFDAAYDKERVLAHLYLPRNAQPPYQTVVYFPSGEAPGLSSSDNLRMRYLDVVLRSGRAVMYPIYKGTFERRRPTPARGLSDLRDLMIEITKDFGRSLDYLETRADIDHEKLAYYGTSWGAIEAPLCLAGESRIKAAILQGGGLRLTRRLPEMDAFNFAPRVTQPVLLMTGRYDFELPLEASQKPYFRLLGTADKDKRHVVFETGHGGYPMPDLIKEILDWLDRYLGAVKTA